MLHSSIKLVGVLAVVLIASSCAVSEERSGPGADGIPDVVVACIDDRPECQDTISTGDAPTGGNTPLGPSTEPGPNGMVVDQGLSVSEAIAYDGSQPVAVHGFVVRTPDGAELCETLAESYPPQCGGASLTLANPDETDGLLLVEDGDVQWSPDIVTLIGTVAGSDLTIDISSI